MSRMIVAVILALIAVMICFASTATASQKLQVVAESWPPFEFEDPEKGVIGIDVDIATHIFNKMNIDFEIHILTWTRAWRKIQEGEADAALSVSRKAKREPFLYYPQQNMWVSEYVFFVHKDKKRNNFGGYEDAKRLNLRIGVVPGNSYNEAFWKTFPYIDKDGKKLHHQLDSANSMELNLKKLAKGRIDLYIVDKTIGLYAIKQLKLQDILTYYPQPLFSKGYPMPFAKNSTYPDIKKIAERFEAELLLLKESGKYDEIFDKWLN